MTNLEIIEQIETRIAELTKEHSNRTNGTKRGGRNPVAQMDRISIRSEINGLEYALGLLVPNQACPVCNLIEGCHVSGCINDTEITNQFLG